MWAGLAAQRERWQRTAAGLALLANCHRDPKRAAFTVGDFMPQSHAPPPMAPMPSDITALKMFLKGK